MFVVLSAILIPFAVSAQFSIRGKVVSSSQKPLTGASVTLSNSLLSTETNSSGNYSLRSLEPGTYKVKVSFLGFKTEERTISISADRELDFTLHPTSIIAEEVIVQSTRAASNAPTTYRNVSREEIEKNNLGQDLPYLLNQTPSVVVSSDAGAGVGYTGIRIRGSDPTRINVTINGIPYNDSESQGTFWVNMPDFASSVDNIQIQRGVGTSTNGAGAFGASINVQTTTRRDTAYAELNNSYGSYETWKNTVNVGTGLINGKFSIDGRLSRIKSDGYIDRAFSNLKSYYLSGSYYGKNSLLRANVFSGTERTYQAWNGVPQDLLETNRTYNEFTYDDQTDNYTQDHYQLLYSHNFSPKFSFNGALHYTHGRGYYEEFKEDQDFEDYNFEPVVVGGETIDKTDLVRRRWLDNDFYGLTYSFNYTPVSGLNLTLGGAYNEYDGAHFGQVIWAQYASGSKNFDRYYDYDGFKTDFNVYGKASYRLGPVNLFADMQYRRVTYSFLGFDRDLKSLQQKDKLNFFNPKVGLSYQIDDRSNVYASYAAANREPNRDDYTESSPAVPKPERLNDFEVGYRLNSSHFTAGINGYYMLYKDQLVVTGQINDVGGYLRTNVPDSYRMGLEFDGRWRFSEKLSWGATATFSKNKVKNFTEFLDMYDDDFEWTGQTEQSYGTTDIAFSPSIIASSEIAFNPIKRAEIAFISKYVGDQYLDNTSNSARKIDDYFVNDLRLRYDLKLKQVKNLGLTLLVNNIFSEKYVNNGWTYAYLYSGNVTADNAYYPQATRNFLLSLNVKF